MRTFHKIAMLLALAALAGCAKPPPGTKFDWNNQPDTGPATVTQSLSNQGTYAGSSKPLPGSFNE